MPLTREIPRYPASTYALFGLAGATGCAVTHALVIPLDVVKTRVQTDNNNNNYSSPPSSQTKGGSSILAMARHIVDTEGVGGLLLGAQATLAGYFWYGLSVYPSYTFLKRFLTLDVCAADYAVAHANQIALLAGALAAVVASLGLTPLEAARIRVVAEPEIYRPLGLTGTLAVIAREDVTLGWSNLYAGLPSLLTRQVVFGSVKFLAFERAAEAIYAQFPVMRDATWTALLVSLVAGGLSGVLSSVVSQPADSVLTFVAQGNQDDGGNRLGLLDGARQMVQRDGPGALFRGLGSRCVWAGSIIAGQFLLYDIFRTMFGVSAADLTQIYQISFPQ
jgi:solute carrier family 25 phosphate transporter 3